MKKGSRKQDVLLLLDLAQGPVHLPRGSLRNEMHCSAAREWQQEEEDDPICIPCSRTPSPESRGNYFRDRKTKIDFVLVWEEKLWLPGRGALAGLTRTERQRLQHHRWRQKFQRNLRAAGLLLEEEETPGEQRAVHYLKLSAPWEVLTYYAEDLCMRAPLQVQPNPDSDGSAEILRQLHLPNPLQQHVPNKPLDFYTCAFRRSKLSKFLGSDFPDSYFSNTQRHRVVAEILARTVYGKRKHAEMGIARLLTEGVYTAAFPLHEGPFELPGYPVPGADLNPRQLLYAYWARWCCWHKYQPLDHVREYFGEKVAIYFAWLGFYTAWLLPAAIVGTLVFLSGLLTMSTNTPAEEICASGDTFVMCPLCATCATWNISEICPMAKLGYLFDNPGTVFFSIFMSFWAMAFLEHWRRKNATLAHHWDCADFQEEEERPRPEFAAMAPQMAQNPVTGLKEPYFPTSARLSRMVTGSMAILVMLCVVMIFLVSVIMYRGIVSIVMFHTGNPVLMTQVIAPLQGRAGKRKDWGGCRPFLHSSCCHDWPPGRWWKGKVEDLKSWLCHFLAGWQHCQHQQYLPQPGADSPDGKGVHLASGAAHQVGFVGYPGQYGTLLGMRNEDCGPGGCLIELAQQLFIIMVGKQLANNVEEFVLPKIKAWWQKRQLAGLWGAQMGQDPRRWEDDYELIECEGLFEEYLEMVLQFGFITIFVAAFPLAPLFALLNNWVEIRLDAHKFVCEYRRPVAERAQGIGVWLLILETMAHLSVIVNAFLIAFTSDFLPRLLYQYEHHSHLQGYVNFTLAQAPHTYLVQGNHTPCRYKAFRDETGDFTLFYWKLLAVRLGFILAFEHVVFFFLRLIAWLVPDVPADLALQVKRERYLAKQALADNQDALFSQGSCPLKPHKRVH
ncbi:anoctamin-7-like isoform X2 [Dromiciops gliroides]|uniref:anoctamin-7-like isoform X2 n=1 Tax=Dromiciops gliroides TaxID=33562 RepID=UPI001CC570F9|nr:anoctamin-7-like isoform X2 [Dromiciops gliroides]